MKTASLLNDIVYQADRVDVTLIMETERSKELRICLKEGQEMKKHHTPFPVVIEVFEGEIILGLEEGPLALEKGMLVSLGANVTHNLKALKDSIVRASISKSDDLKKIESITAEAAGHNK
jgi:quercetin dioxygenase-like cupin family protein